MQVAASRTTNGMGSIMPHDFANVAGRRQQTLCDAKRALGVIELQRIPRYALNRTGGTLLGIRRVQPVVAVISSIVTPGAISLRAMPSGVMANSP